MENYETNREDACAPGVSADNRLTEPIRLGIHRRGLVILGLRTHPQEPIYVC
jgi:hypothetical protein